MSYEVLRTCNIDTFNVRMAALEPIDKIAIIQFIENILEDATEV